MLACARLGAVHSIVFGGFSAEALRDRIVDCGAKCVITQDIGLRGGRKIRLKAVADEAMAGQAVDHCLVVRRTGDDVGWTEGPFDHLYYMFFPALLLGVNLSGSVMRMTRTMVLEVMRQDYIRTAYAKGLQERTVLVRHAMKNALIPVITIIGLQVGTALSGTLIIETIFNMPGVGRYFIGAILAEGRTKPGSSRFRNTRKGVARVMTPPMRSLSHSFPPSSDRFCSIA